MANGEGIAICFAIGYGLVGIIIGITVLVVRESGSSTGGDLVVPEPDVPYISAIINPDVAEEYLPFINDGIASINRVLKGKAEQFVFTVESPIVDHILPHNSSKTFVRIL